MIKTLLSSSTVAPLVDTVAVVEWNGSVGQPKLSISRDVLENLSSINLLLTTLADAHGISRSILKDERPWSVRNCYSDIPANGLLDVFAAGGFPCWN